VRLLSVIPALGRLRQEHRKIIVSRGCLVSSRPARATWLASVSKQSESDERSLGDELRFCGFVRGHWACFLKHTGSCPGTLVPRALLACTWLWAISFKITSLFFPPEVCSCSIHHQVHRHSRAFNSNCPLLVKFLYLREPTVTEAGARKKSWGQRHAEGRGHACWEPPHITHWPWFI
jgi:hypothetical protein